MQICDQCYMPGYCCSGFFLSDQLDETNDKAVIEAHLRLSHPEVPFFHPIYQGAALSWRFACTKLTDKGRCGIYSERPECGVGYPPGHDGLCCHFTPLEAGDPTTEFGTTVSYRRDSTNWLHLDAELTSFTAFERHLFIEKDNTE